MELATALDEARNGVPWRKPGETIKSARDRLKAQREAAKRRLEGATE